ncbi:uncharacterized protein B0H64DRAFT_405080 [Chaetomium fimeti]|uniref:Uncharacterized protein n=1 Tax=Chaetomium fimeti TaxID=1854472 RepID=A0AAE0LQ13_9PEZI|nr:hypothetical protein B0H64DRAFT_405080 [Chaetomium fimeti]
MGGNADSFIVGLTEHPRLKDVERERDELRAKVTRLDAEKRIFTRDVRKVLTESKSNEWQPNGDPYHQILEFAVIHEARARTASEAQESWIRAYKKEKRQRIAREKTVQQLTAKLDYQAQTAIQATENQHKLEAGNEWFQHLVNTRVKEYQGMMQSQEKRHSAMLQRLINAHTAEMSEQMTVYEKELADLRVQHERELAEKPNCEGG